MKSNLARLDFRKNDQSELGSLINPIISEENFYEICSYWWQWVYRNSFS